ncbi:MAG: flippase-like protein [Neobacillus sp.]|nr:flippase-like protein [Neobacillus sp.]
MQETRKSRVIKNLFSAVTILFSIGILVFFMRTEDGIKNLRHVLFHLQPVWLLWIAGGVLSGWLLESYVLHLFCRHLNKDWTFGQSFYVGMVELFYSALTPFGMGEPVEIYNMTKMGMDIGTASSIVAVKSLVHHGVTFFYSLILISFELNYFQTMVSNFSFISLFGLITNSIFIIGVLMFMINEKLTNSLLQVCVRFLDKIKMHKLSQKLNNKVHNELLIFHDSTKTIGKSYSLYVFAIFLTLVQITIAGLISYFVYRSFNLNGESVFTMVAGDTFVTMAASFIPLPGSSGGAEGGFYLFFRGFFGASIIPAITLWRISTFYVNILFCGILVYFGRKKYRL